jgi:succinate-semialdehyde dehydrogenase / glutarate-semialdehyde dehydrogenase
MSVATRRRSRVSDRFTALAARVTTERGEREELEIENPALGQPLGAVPKCTAEDVELAMTRARPAQATWAQTDFSARRDFLMRVHDLVWTDRMSCST